MWIGGHCKFLWLHLVCILRVCDCLCVDIVGSRTENKVDCILPEFTPVHAYASTATAILLLLPLQFDIPILTRWNHIQSASAGTRAQCYISIRFCLLLALIPLRPVVRPIAVSLVGHTPFCFYSATLAVSLLNGYLIGFWPHRRRRRRRRVRLHSIFSSPIS